MLVSKHSISPATHKHISNSLRSVLPRIKSESLRQLAGLTPTPQKFRRYQVSTLLSGRSSKDNLSFKLLRNINIIKRDNFSEPNIKVDSLKKISSQQRFQSMDDLLKKFKNLKKTEKFKQATKGMNRVNAGFGRLRKEITRMQNLDEDYNEFVKVWKTNLFEEHGSDIRFKELRSRMRIIKKRKEKLSSKSPEKVIHKK